jgi:hypothetical protein
MTQEENDALNLQTMQGKGMKPMPNGFPKSTDPLPPVDGVAQAQKIGQLMHHASQGHDGDPMNCPDCGTVVDPNSTVPSKVLKQKIGLPQDPSAF